MPGVVGFTGTRLGMSSKQLEQVQSILKNLNPKLVVHGGCKGADKEFHDIALKQQRKIRIRPCGYLSSHHPQCEIMPVKPPLKRNLDIIKDASVIIATPPTETEIIRSGTWHTIRHAAKQKVKVIIVWPSGRVEIRSV